MIARNKNEKGFTLVELIITIAFLAIIITVLMNIFVISNESFSSGVDKATIQQDARICADEIYDHLRFAKNVSINAPTDEDYYKIYLENNSETGLKSMVIEKLRPSTYLHISISKTTVGKYISSINFETETGNNKLVNYNISVNASAESYSINSAVLLNNTNAIIPSGTTVLYFTLYE